MFSRVFLTEVQQNKGVLFRMPVTEHQNTTTRITVL